MTIRSATIEDLPAMVSLSEAKREEYEPHAPVFWRRATDSAERQAEFFADELDRDSAVFLIAEVEGRIIGFLRAGITAAPPVYNPGTRVCIIDDFTVATDDLWAAVGAALLAEARRLAAEQGARLTVAVCGAHDEPKRAMLRAAGLAVASEWYVG